MLPFLWELSFLRSRVKLGLNLHTHVDGPNRTVCGIFSRRYQLCLTLWSTKNFSPCDCHTPINNANLLKYLVTPVQGKPTGIVELPTVEEHIAFRTFGPLESDLTETVLRDHEVLHIHEHTRNFEQEFIPTREPLI